MNNDSPSNTYAQGGQQDTDRTKAQGDYQQGQAESSPQTNPPEGSHPQKQPPTAPAQGGQQDTDRAKPQGDYQQGQSS